jgi:hypothetical protein
MLALWVQEIVSIGLAVVMLCQNLSGKDFACGVVMVCRNWTTFIPSSVIDCTAIARHLLAAFSIY